MGKEEYTPPRITRREAVGKFTIAGLGGAGAGKMAMSPIEMGSPESLGSGSQGSDDDSDSPHPPERGPPEPAGPPSSAGGKSQQSTGEGRRGRES